MTKDEEYVAAFVRAWGAARKWRKEHPDTVPEFKPLKLPPSLPGRGRFIGTVGDALAHGVAGNQAARELLEAIAQAVPEHGGATIMMAEYALEQELGIKSALTRQTSN